MIFNPAHSFADALKQAKAEKSKVTVHLRGNATFSGNVGEVGDHHVVIAELSGKEFFDAMIRIDQITAIEARVRSK